LNRRFDPLRFIHLYIGVLGAGLVLDAMLELSISSTSDITQNLLHLVWGIALLIVAFLAREGHADRAVWAALASGTFSIALGILGLTIEQPLGMQLGTGDKFFYISQGLVSLVIGAWCLRLMTRAPVPSHTTVQPVVSRNGPVARRRPRRRRGTGRGGQRRR
jgi:hypothetical protein